MKLTLLIKTIVITSFASIKIIASGVDCNFDLIDPRTKVLRKKGIFLYFKINYRR